MMKKTYNELINLDSFRERFKYLYIGEMVGVETFGYNRELNQLLYTSKRWRSLRNDIIIRDNGCDLGVEGFEIYRKILIHHINPITIDDVRFDRDLIYDPNNLISTNMQTHNALHFGSPDYYPERFDLRTPGDTIPWKTKKGGQNYGL